MTNKTKKRRRPISSKETRRRGRERKDRESATWWHTRGQGKARTRMERDCACVGEGQEEAKGHEGDTQAPGNEQSSLDSFDEDEVLDPEERIKRFNKTEFGKTRHLLDQQKATASQMDDFGRQVPESASSSSSSSSSSSGREGKASSSTLQCSQFIIQDQTSTSRWRKADSSIRMRMDVHR